MAKGVWVGGTVAAVGLWAVAGRAGELPPFEFAYVPATDRQIGGPDYGFLIGRFEVRNDQFAAFLNDALANLHDERGAFLHFDTISGNVHIHSTAHGTAGPGGEGPLIFSTAPNPYVIFDNGEYRAQSEFENHPVTGVSWFGAVKFCNWLTLEVGLPAAERAYTEGPAANLNGWHPVTISGTAWATRDLNNAERVALRGKLGFRLPMDGGAGGGDTGSYNEWYKAAAWDPRAGVNRLYGFGRDVIDGADANFRCSGDPFEEPGDCNVGGTSPVGYHNGSDHGGAFPTRADQNGYRLFDVSGNVWEWMQDQSFDQADRGNRGGSFRNSINSLLTTIGAERSADSASDSTGFRVAFVQSVVGGLLVIPQADLVNDGPWGGPYLSERTQRPFRISNVGGSAIEYAATVNEGWVTLSGPVMGTLAAGDSVELVATIDAICDDELTVGANEATVLIAGSAPGALIERRVLLTVTEPLTVTPDDRFVASMPFGAAPAGLVRTMTLASTSDSSVSWSARAADTTNPAAPSGPASWLTIDGAAAASGQLSPRETRDVVVGIDPAAAAGLAAGAHTADVVFLNECTGSQFVRQARLVIVPPLEVTPAGDPVSSGVCEGPFAPTAHLLRIANPQAADVDWVLVVDPPELIGVSAAGGVIGPAGRVDVVASVLSAAADLPLGEHPVSLTFIQPSTGFSLERRIIIEVTEVAVSPMGAASLQGPLGGPFAPVSRVYTLRNTGVSEMEWTAAFVETTTPPSGVAWLSLSATHGTILNPDGIAEIVATPAPQADLLPSGTFTGRITFTSAQAPSCAAVRELSLVVGGEGFSLPMVRIPAADVQTGGPAYDFRIGKFEVTNSEFARFLNDAIVNTETERGAFMDHGDPPAGVVQLNGDGTMLFDAGKGGAIEFVGGRYEVVHGAEAYPVVGVSWYGAAKFCNWMTLVQGMGGPPDQRAYHEGAEQDDWYPIRAAPAQLAAEIRGFRLPMDDEAGGASSFNEWHKAASRRGADAHGRPIFGALYGFGGNALTSADANFFESGDTVAEGPTPVGFFNGFTQMAGGSLSRNTANGYGLYDLCGNVGEWVQDVGDGAAHRGVRGGHFNNAAVSPLLTTTGRDSLPAAGVYPFVGFRVLQAIDTVDLIVTQSGFRSEGFAGGPYDPAAFTLHIENPSTTLTVEPITVALHSPGDAWLSLEGVGPRQVPPGAVVDFSLRIKPSGAVPGVSPIPPGDFVYVASEQAQGSIGPRHDYWIGKTEVTNRQFRDFLNDARTNALSPVPDARSHHMYFDRDSGSVYIHTQRLGQEGTAAPSAALSFLFYDASVGRVRLVNNTYAVQSGYENHPVVGVSWYGAVKYCNWLTVTQGAPGYQPAYGESPGPDLAGWRPMIEGDRARFAVEAVGYRLLMDDEAGGPSPYNEWFKAAARDSVQGDAARDRVFGFGRDKLTSADANFLQSGDTELEGTTPVRFFDGVQRLFLQASECFPVMTMGTLTADTDSGYGIYDVCGNVAEWVHDVGDTSADRATRGGSWRDAVDSPLLSNAGRRSRPATATLDDTGFRVCRGTGHVAKVTVTNGLQENAIHELRFILDACEPLRLEPAGDILVTARYGDDLAGLPDPPAVYTLTNQSATATNWETHVDADWLAAIDAASGLTQGVIVGDSSLTLDVSTNERAEALAPGRHVATVTVRNVIPGQPQRRTFEIVIDPPIVVAPAGPLAFEGLFGGPFEALPAAGYTLTNDLAHELSYEISADQSWVTLQPADELSGFLQPFDPDDPTSAVSVEVMMNSAATALQAGQHSAHVRFTFHDPASNNLTSAIEREVVAEVGELVDVAQASEPWMIGPMLDSKTLPSQVYSLTNRAAAPIDVLIDVDQVWLDVDASFAQVLPNQEAEIIVSVNDRALEMFDGVHTGMVTFEDTVTGVVLCRTAILTIEEALSVDPFSDFDAAGVAGGPITPAAKTYTLTNVARDAAGAMEWEAIVRPPGWVTVNGGVTAGGVLQEGASARVLVAIDVDQTADLPEGAQMPVIVEFRDVTGGSQVLLQSRPVNLTLVVPQFPVLTSLVSAAAAQPGGPAYSYVAAKDPTSNVEFVAFLNDALANQDNERGEHMFFDPTTGDVYVNSVGPGRRMFSPAVSGQIRFSGGVYDTVVSPVDYSQHPATGVSWYGAVKYCNWLTLDQGMLPDQRCYVEDASGLLAAWRPATISAVDWLVRDLNDVEQARLAAGYRGYRLPMDDGYNNASPSTDVADEYNEWYKAGAFNDALRQNTVYGFGRNILTGADANYRDSGDPFDNGTTPRGRYDPVNANGFQLSDMTGNVYQWMQGRYNANPASINFRALRGGSWNDPIGAAGLLMASRTFTSTDLLNTQIGFRVVRALAAATGDFDHDGDSDRSDFARLVQGLNGPGGGLFPEWAVFDFDHDGDIDLKDVAAFQRRLDGP